MSRSDRGRGFPGARNDMVISKAEVLVHLDVCRGSPLLRAQWNTRGSEVGIVVQKNLYERVPFTLKGVSAVINSRRTKYFARKYHIGFEGVGLAFQSVGMRVSVGRIGVLRILVLEGSSAKSREKLMFTIEGVGILENEISAIRSLVNSDLVITLPWPSKKKVKGDMISDVEVGPSSNGAAQRDSSD
ncbi:hypothetical protein BKA93DRAFT_750758 [Sparassis latifolia]